MRLIAIALIRICSKCLSYFNLYSCKFYPSCSNYAIESVRKRGIFKGGLMSMGRLLRCCPFSMGGYDPPERTF